MVKARTAVVLLLLAAGAAGVLLLLRPGLPAGPALPPATLPHAPRAAPVPTDAELEEPTEGLLFEGFRAAALYRNGGGRAVGVRWIHEPTGTPLLLLRAQGSPGLLVSVSTISAGDRGEAHSGEHLLLGRGDRGRRLRAVCDRIALSVNAATYPDSVQYGMTAHAGEKALLAGLDPFLEAILQPDYTDEEIRREVYFVDLRTDPATGDLEPLEAGSIYNEMSAPTHRRTAGYRAMMAELAGPGHPLAAEEGGTPEGIRESTPEAVRAFHRRFYRLGPGFLIAAALPPGNSPAPTLRSLSRTLGRLAAAGDGATASREVVPDPRPVADRAVRTVPYPGNHRDGGNWIFVGWPAIRGLSTQERLLAKAFLELLAGGKNSLLHRRLAAESDRFFAGMEERCDAYLMERGDDAFPCLMLGAIYGRQSTPGVVERIRNLLAMEILRVASLPADAPEVAVLHGRLRSHVGDTEAWLLSGLDVPPLFGRSRAGAFWLEQVGRADASGGYERAITLDPAFEELRRRLSSSENVLPALVERLGLLEVPVAVLAVPDSVVAAGEEEATRLRLEEFVRGCMEEAGTQDPQAALRARSAPVPPGAEDGDPLPPLPDLRDLLRHRREAFRSPPCRTVGDDERILAVEFETMNTLHMEVSLHLDDVAEAHLPWLAALPRLLSAAGVLAPEGLVPHERLGERYGPAAQPLSVWAGTMEDDRFPELALGISCRPPAGCAEAVRCIEERLFTPALDETALPAIRQTIRTLFDEAMWTVHGLSEDSAADLAADLGHREDAAWLSALSSHTALLHLRRLELRLAARPALPALLAVDRFLEELPAAAADGYEATLVKFSAHLSEQKGGSGENEAAWVQFVATQVRALLPYLDYRKPGAAAADLRALAEVAGKDIRVSTEEALGQLEALLDHVRTRARARCVVTGPPGSGESIRPPLVRLFARLGKGRSAEDSALPPPRTFSTDAFRGEGKGSPLFLGVRLPPDTPGTFSFRSSTRTPGSDGDLRRRVLRGLGVGAIGGSARDSVFEAVRDRGIAYGIGIRGGGGRDGEIFFDGTRCRDLPGIMEIAWAAIRRIADERRASLAESGTSFALRSNEEDERFPLRARRLARRHWEGLPASGFPGWAKTVGGILEDPRAGDEIRETLLEALGPLVPGSGRCAAAVRGEVRLLVVSAPEPELARWEEWVRSREGIAVERFAPRDLWVVE